MKIAICEDEQKQQEFLKDTLQRLKTKEQFQIFVFGSGEELIESYNSDYRYDIILLDVRMKGIDGIKTAEFVREYDPNCIIIIITSTIEYAVDGYGVNAFDFILKPVDEEKFKKVMKRAFLQMNKCKSMLYRIEDKGLSTVIKLEDINFIESHGRKVIVHCSNELEYVSNNNISDEEDRLITKGFLRVSRYYLVNLRHVKEILTKEIIMKNGATVPINQRNRKKIYDSFMNYMMEGLL